MCDEERIVYNSAEDQEWADLLSPTRRKIIVGAGLTAAGLTAGNIVAAGQEVIAPGSSSFKPIVPPPKVGKSPWGYETYKEPTPRPRSVRPGEENGLPKAPRPYTDIKSYHAHFYFDEDAYEKAALVRKGSADRFPVELGNWNLEPRGPHVTPSYTLWVNRSQPVNAYGMPKQASVEKIFPNAKPTVKLEI